MKISKAIEILDLYMKPSDDIEPVDFDTAIKLGREALKRIKAIRTHQSYSVHPSLPGEDSG